MRCSQEIAHLAFAQSVQSSLEAPFAQSGEYRSDMFAVSRLQDELDFNVLGCQRGESSLVVNFIDVGSCSADQRRDCGKCSGNIAGANLEPGQSAFPHQAAMDN